MSLPTAQQRVLDGIADGLRRTEPKLAAMYAIFTRLCGSDGLPVREQLIRHRAWLTERSRRAWRMVLIASQIAVAIVLLAVLASLPWRSSAGCGQPGRQRAAPPARLWCASPAAVYGIVGK